MTQQAVGGQGTFGGMPTPLYLASPSRLSAWLDCPRRYRMQYLDRPRPAARAQRAHTSVGIATHNALRDFWDLAPAQRTPARVAELVRTSWIDVGFRDPEQSSAWRMRVRGAVTDYLRRDSTAATGADFDGFCNILANLAGDCTQTPLQAYQALNNPATRPYKAGLRQSYGANVSGGSDQVTYFVSGAYENEIGPFRLPKIEEDSVRAVRGTVPGQSASARTPSRSTRSAPTSTPTSPRRSTWTPRSASSRSNTRFIENDNSFLTVNGSGTASGNLPEVMTRMVLHPGPALRRTGQPGGQPLHRRLYRQLASARVADRPGHHRLRRGQPHRRAVLPHRRGGADSGQNRAGCGSQNRFDISQASVDLGASARFRLSDAVGSRTSVGGQFFRDLARGNFATGRGLPAGSGTITGAAPPKPGIRSSSRVRSARTSRKRSISRSGSSSPARCASTTTAPSARTSTRRCTPRRASPG